MQKWTSIAICCLLIQACTPSPPIETHIPKANAFWLGQHECVTIVSLLRAAALGNTALVDSFSTEVNLRTETVDGFTRIRLAFGDSALGTDGRMRSGTINLIADPGWPAEGTSAQIIPSDYNITSRAGKKGFLSASRWEVRGLAPASGTIPLLEHHPRGLHWQFDAIPVTWNNSFQQAFLIGSNTPEIKDDLILIESNSAINLANETVEFRIAPPLIWNGDCPVFTGGRASFSQEKADDLSIDFGLNECNDAGTLRIGEDESLEIILKE
jgi:hypothetical protein